MKWSGASPRLSTPRSASAAAWARPPSSSACRYRDCCPPFETPASGRLLRVRWGGFQKNPHPEERAKRASRRVGHSKNSETEMINYNVDSDGIATITWDMPNRTMNVLNEGSITAYAGALETALKDDKVKGIIVTSGKADFIAGADLEMLLNADTSDAAKLTEQFSQLQKLFRRQEPGAKPIVAAINGTALGGGFEICLASRHRIAAANPKAK